MRVHSEAYLRAEASGVTLLLGGRCRDQAYGCDLDMLVAHELLFLDSNQFVACAHLPFI
jgi:hypothetical protein